MTTQAITLQLPDPVYDHFRSRANRTHRSVEVEILDVVTTAAVEEHGLADDLAEAVTGLEILDDDALWRAARSELPEESRERLEALNFKQQSEGLDSTGHTALEQLLHTYDRVMLVRAHAARLLQERGHDVSALGPQ